MAEVTVAGSLLGLGLLLGGHENVRSRLSRLSIEYYRGGRNSYYLHYFWGGFLIIYFLVE